MKFRWTRNPAGRAAKPFIVSEIRAEGICRSASRYQRHAPESSDGESCWRAALGQPDVIAVVRSRFWSLPGDTVSRFMIPVLIISGNLTVVLFQPIHDVVLLLCAKSHGRLFLRWSLGTGSTVRDEDSDKCQIFILADVPACTGLRRLTGADNEQLWSK